MYKTASGNAQRRRENAKGTRKSAPQQSKLRSIPAKKPKAEKLLNKGYAPKLEDPKRIEKKLSARVRNVVVVRKSPKNTP